MQLLNVIAYVKSSCFYSCWEGAAPKHGISDCNKRLCPWRKLIQPILLICFLWDFLSKISLTSYITLTRGLGGKYQVDVSIKERFCEYGKCSCDVNRQRLSSLELLSFKPALNLVELNPWHESLEYSIWSYI